jgi:hypothetical protein
MRFWGTATVVKRNKRMFIEVLETGKELYTPPDHLRPHIKTRDKLRELAHVFTIKQERRIEDVIAFEGELYSNQKCTGSTIASASTSHGKNG